MPLGECGLKLKVKFASADVDQYIHIAITVGVIVSVLSGLSLARPVINWKVCIGKNTLVTQFER